MSAKNSSWRTTKIVTSVALAVLLLVDLGLGIFLWRDSRQQPADLRAELKTLVTQAELRKADVERGAKIRTSLPQVSNDCSKFYGDTFLDKSTGYSAVLGDLSAIAAKSGSRMSDTGLKEDQVKDRSLTEVAISTSVEGTYSSVIKFINGLEQSKNFYLLNDLHLTSANGGMIKLQLDLRTYFRT
jgi:type IV pilus assembly protein PilO